MALFEYEVVIIGNFFSQISSHYSFYLSFFHSRPFPINSNENTLILPKSGISYAHQALFFQKKITQSTDKLDQPWGFCNINVKGEKVVYWTSMRSHKHEWRRTFKTSYRGRYTRWIVEAIGHIIWSVPVVFERSFVYVKAKIDATFAKDWCTNAIVWQVRRNVWRCLTVTWMSFCVVSKRRKHGFISIQCTLVKFTKSLAKKIWKKKSLEQFTLVTLTDRYITLPGVYFLC